MTERQPTTIEPDELDSGAPEGGSSPFRKLHSLLRGRYPWAIALALVFAVPGAVAGWMLLKPTYLSQGIVYIAPSVPTVDDPMAQSVKPMFEGFIKAQVAVMTSQRVMHKAMQSPDWVSLKTGMDLGDFEEAVEVKHLRGSLHITVGFRHQVPTIAQVGVKVMVHAYLSLAKDVNIENDKATLEQLDATRTSLGNQIAMLDKDLLAISNRPGGISGLEIQLQLLITEGQQLEEDIRDLEEAVRRLEKAIADGGGGADPDRDLTREEWARKDPKLSELLIGLMEQEDLVERLQISLGQKNRKLIAEKQKIAAMNRVIDRYVRLLNETRPDLADNPLLAELESARKDLARARERHEKVNADASKLSVARFHHQKLSTKRESLIRSLNQANDAYANVSALAKSKGRIRILNEGDVPVTPDKDRRAAAAAGLGMAGAGFGIFLVLLRGLLDRRLRDSVDLAERAPRFRILGLLPGLDDDSGERPATEVATLGVHHIRSLLEIEAGQESGRALCVTGPMPGSGKTLISVALGVSYSASGVRVLLVDADLRGRGLTVEVQRLLRRKLAETAPDAEGHALPEIRDLPALLFRSLHGEANGGREADRLRESLRRAAADRGLESTRADGLLDALDRPEWEEALQALTETNRNEGDEAGGTNGCPPRPLGLLDAMDGHDLGDCAVPTGLRNLQFLPAGRGAGAASGRLSHATLGRLLAVARDRFDVIVIDTGPVPACADASMVAAQVDGVLVTVARGEQRTLVKAALEHLGAIGARISGLVLNRAELEDALQSSSSYARSGSQEEVA